MYNFCQALWPREDCRQDEGGIPGVVGIVIANGFRAAASSRIFSTSIADGFARWAEVLERYHASKCSVG